MNGAFDPDPLLGSGSLTGFTEYAALYGNYRVMDFTYEVKIASLETAPMIVLIAPTATDIGGNYSGTNELSEFPHGRSDLISAQGGMDRCTFSGAWCPADIFGDRAEYFGDDNFGAGTGSNPSFQLYLNVGIYKPTSALVSGVVAKVRLGYKVMFYGKKNVLTAVRQRPLTVSPERAQPLQTPTWADMVELEERMRSPDARSPATNSMRGRRPAQ